MAINKHALTSIKWFFLGSALSLIYPLCIANNKSLNETICNNVISTSVIYTAIFILYIYLKLPEIVYEIAIRSFGLGVVFGCAILISLWSDTKTVIFGWYLCLLSFFHVSEYVTTALTNPRTLSLDSFLINHSREYSLAAVFSWIEFWLERVMFPSLKEYHIISYFGIAMCVTGEIIRKLAMFTAKTNFNHVVQVKKEKGHILVTNGIYKLWRHPSYVGWFWWSVGTQIVLCNPICLVGYTIASWNFFNDRIYEEEITLLNFFGGEYLKYQRKVPTGLPFITGFRVEL